MGRYVLGMCWAGGDLAGGPAGQVGRAAAVRASAPGRFVQLLLSRAPLHSQLSFTAVASGQHRAPPPRSSPQSTVPQRAARTRSSARTGCGTAGRPAPAM